MDLTDMMKRDSAIVDHEWLMKKNGLHTQGQESLLDVENLKEPNNCKPELEMQWGGGGPNIDLDEPAGIVERNFDDDSEPEGVIVFARDLMNRGLMGRDLNKALCARFDKTTLKAASKGLSEQFAWEGIVGCVAVDGRGYKNCKAAMAATELSPYKGFIRYVLGCDCGTPHSLPVTPRGDLIGAQGDSTGSAVDDFLAAAPAERVQMVDHCRSTMLPLLADDLDPSEMQDGLMDVTNTLRLPESLTKDLRKKGGVEGFKGAFLWAQKNKEAIEDREYTERVDASEFFIAPTDQVVEINAPAQASIDVDGSVPSKIPTLSMDEAAPSTVLDGATDLHSEIVADLVAPAAEALDVSPGGLFSDINLSPTASDAMDVDMQPHLAGEFLGTDEVDLEDMKAPVRQLDIEF